MSTTERITIKLVETRSFTRWPCHVCGGCTEKVRALAEGKHPADESVTIRVCEDCLRAGDIDARLARHADCLAGYAENIRSLIGRLDVLTYADWQAAAEAFAEAWVRDYEKDTGIQIENAKEIKREAPESSENDEWEKPF